MERSLTRPKNVVSAGDLDWVPYGRGRYVREQKKIGGAAGTRTMGVKLERLQAGKSDVPLHWHLAEEEGFLALEGEAELVQTDARGDQERRTRFSAGQAVTFRADQRVAHRLDCQTDAAEPFVYLVWGERAPVDFNAYPPRNVWMVRKGTQGAAESRADGLGAFTAEPVDYYQDLPDADGPPAAGGSPSEFGLPYGFGVLGDLVFKPSPIADVTACAPRRFGKGRYARDCQQLGPLLGAERFDVNVDTVEPGHVDAPFHYHLGDEEFFLVLEGNGVLRMGGPGWEGDEVETPLGPNDAAAFAPATGLAHQIQVPDDAERPLRLLVIATRAPVDAVRMVDSDKWIIKRPDLSKAQSRAFGSAIVPHAPVDWLHDEQDAT